MHLWKHTQRTPNVEHHRAPVSSAADENIHLPRLSGQANKEVLESTGSVPAWWDSSNTHSIYDGKEKQQLQWAGIG